MGISAEPQALSKQILLPTSSRTCPIALHKLRSSSKSPCSVYLTSKSQHLWMAWMSWGWGRVYFYLKLPFKPNKRPPLWVDFVSLQPLLLLYSAAPVSSPIYIFLFIYKQVRSTYPITFIAPARHAIIIYHSNYTAEDREAFHVSATVLCCVSWGGFGLFRLLSTNDFIRYLIILYIYIYIYIGKYLQAKDAGRISIS